MGLFGGDRPTICCFGDSLTEGYGLSAAESYPALLQQRLVRAGNPHRVVNHGVSGETSGDALRRLGRAVRIRPAIAVIALGANDAFQGVPRHLLESNLAEIILRFQRAGARVVLAGLWIPPLFGVRDPEGLQALYAKLSDRYAVTLIPDFMAGVLADPAGVLIDGFHPSAVGYARIEATVWRAMEPLLTSGEEDQE